MAEITKAQIKCIKAVVNKLGVDGASITVGVSMGRTEHVKELTVQEGTAMIRALKAMDPDEKSADKQRKKIIGMAYQRAGLAQHATQQQKRAVVDWLNGWCKQYGYLKKGLDSYTNDELPKLVSQFEMVLKDLIINI